MTVSYDASLHREYQARVERQRQENVAAEMKGLAELECLDTNISILIAVASKGEGKVNQHFGHATEFEIYEASATGAKFVGHRRVDLYCQGGYDDDEILPNIIRAINDCHAVLVAKIGACPRDELTKAGIDPVDDYAFNFIEASAIAYFKTYMAKVAAGEISHQARGDAQIRQGAYTAAA